MSYITRLLVTVMIPWDSLFFLELFGMTVPANTAQLSTAVQLYCLTTSSPSASLSSAIRPPHSEVHLAMQASPLVWRSMMSAPISDAISLNSGVGIM